MNDAVVAVLEEIFSDGDPLERAKAAEAVIGYCHARQQQAIHQLLVNAELESADQRRPAATDARPVIHRKAPDQSGQMNLSYLSSTVLA